MQAVLSPQAALEQMLGGTPLAVFRDKESNALGIRRAPDGRRGPSTASEQTTASASSPGKPTSDPSQPQQTMKRNKSLTVVGAFIALTFGHIFGAETSGGPSGTITGQVSNAATYSFLEGAKVSVPGTEFTTLTDRQGLYELSVPPGAVRLEVSYTGLEQHTAQIDVMLGKSSRHDVALTSSVYKLETFTVEGAREGNSRAVSLQRQAGNIKNIVATDTFGNIANGNVGDFLQRLPVCLRNTVVRRSAAYRYAASIPV